MMYADKVAVAIKVNNKVLREFKDTVYLQFGSEFSILLKNLNTTRGIFHVFIDGEDATDNGLVINAGQEVNLERWIKGSLTSGNHFKFIEKTSSIEEYRGNKIEDGLIRIEYQFEKEYVPLQVINNWPYNQAPYNPNTWYTTCDLRNMVCGSLTSSSQAIAMNCSFSNDAGITVPGSHSDQKFTSVSSFVCDPQKYTMIINLLGETPDNRPVMQSVKQRTKPKCQTCGVVNKANARFCRDCGTGLEIFS